MRNLYLICAGAISFAFLVGGTWATEGEKKFDYVGDAKCKICHKAEFDGWMESKHAKAFDVLSAEEKKKPECLTCHITGTTAAGEMITGVGCEACHGPGSEYKSLQIMNKKKWAEEPDKYKQMSIAAGLVFPTEENCKRCHRKEGNPNFKEFVFKDRVTKIHPIRPERLKVLTGGTTPQVKDTTGK